MKEQEPDQSKLLSGPKLLEALFEEKSRPSLRWLREQQKNRTIPFTKIGHLVFFDVAAVRVALASKNIKRRLKNGAVI